MWRAALMGSTGGAGNKAVRDCLHSEADLVESERVEGRGRRGELRKIINPPNMGTKSDPSQDKITIPERKRS